MVGASALSIGVSMFLRDQFSGPARNIRSSAKSVDAEVMKMAETQQRYARNLNTGLALAGVGFMRGLGHAIDAGANYDFIMNHVGIASEATQQEMEKLRNSTEALGRGKTLYGPTKLAESLDIMALANYNANQMMDMLPPMAEAASIAMEDLKSVTDVTTGVMLTYGYGAKDTRAVLNLLTKASVASKADFLTLGEAITYSGDTFRNLNIDLATSTAWLMQLHDVNIKGSMAGTSAANTFRYLSKAIGTFRTGRQDEAMKQLGITAEMLMDNQGNLKNVADIMEIIATAAQGKTSVEGQSLLEAIFGIRGKRGIAPILRDIDKFRQNLQGLYDVDPNYTSSRSAKMMDSLKGDILKLKATGEALFISYTKAIEPMARVVLKIVEPIASMIGGLFKLPFVGNILAGAITGFIVIKTVTWAYRAVLSGLNILMLRSAGTANVLASSMNNVAAATRNATAASTGARTFSVLRGVGPTVMANPNVFRGTGGYVAKNMVGGTGTFKTAQGATQFARGTGWGAGMGMAHAASTVLKGTSLLAKLTPWVGRIVGFMGGPWGIALSIGLPAAMNLLASALNKNTEVQDEEQRIVTPYLKALIENGRKNVPSDYTDSEVLRDVIFRRAKRGSMEEAIDRLGKDEAFKRAVDRYNSGVKGNTNINIHLDSEKKAKLVLKNEQEKALNKTYSF